MKVDLESSTGSWGNGRGTLECSTKNENLFTVAVAVVDADAGVVVTILFEFLRNCSINFNTDVDVNLNPSVEHTRKMIKNRSEVKTSIWRKKRKLKRMKKGEDVEITE